MSRLSAVQEALAGQPGAEHLPLVESLLTELWEARDGDAPSARASAAAEALGPAMLEHGLAPSAGVRLVLSAGRALVDVESSAGGLDGAGARRLGALIDQAAADVAHAVEHARSARRQAWLAFLVHELKNPLNTMLNAIWLLREKGASGPQASRFLDLAERAVRRLEQRARDVRDLDEELLRPPPGWDAAQHQDAHR